MLIRRLRSLVKPALQHFTYAMRCRPYGRRSRQPIDRRIISQTAQVEAITLDQLFDGYFQSRTILKLDVEGSEADILNGTSFERTRARILVIEATKPDSQQETRETWERGLLMRGYIHVWFDGLNRFYLREEDHWRRRFFKTPPNVFDGVRFTPHDRRDQIL